MDNPNVVLVGESDVAFDKLFRTALGGFNKDDVINYLERMARNRKKDTERYAAHIRKLEGELEELRNAAADCDMRIDVMPESSRVSVLESENAALRSEIEVLRLQAAEACPCCSASDEADPAVTEVVCEEPGDTACSAEVEKLRKENASLTMCYTELTAKCAVLEEKLRAYEVEKLRLGEIEEAAHRNAEKIEAQAHEKAATSLESLSARVSAMQDLLADVSTGIDSTTRAIYAELSECGMRYSALRRTADDLSAQLNAIHPSK